jgi:hypothetical protein
MSWMTNELMMDWVKVIWKQRPGNLLTKLVLDSFKGHLTQQVKEEMRKANTDLIVIPGGMTPQLLVLDVFINKPFKDHLRQLYNDWLLEGNHARTPAGKLKKSSVNKLGEWILTAWGRISSESIFAAFKKCCISNALKMTICGKMWKMRMMTVIVKMMLVNKVTGRTLINNLSFQNVLCIVCVNNTYTHTSLLHSMDP